MMINPTSFEDIGHRTTDAEQLMGEGYTLLRGAVSPMEIARLAGHLSPRFSATPFCEGGFYGERTKRFGRLLIRSPHMANLVLHPDILALAEAALGPWCERIQLNLTQAIELHPGALAQFPHRDQDMWQGSLGEVEYLLNVIWPLTPFNRGALFLNGHARATDPFGQVGTRSVSVEVTSVVRASPRSFQVKWRESVFERGSLASTARWTAILTVSVKPPRSAEVLRKNPLGLYIEAIDWSREYEATETPPVARTGGEPRAPLESGLVDPPLPLAPAIVSAPEGNLP